MIIKDLIDCFKGERKFFCVEEDKKGYILDVDDSPGCMIFLYAFTLFALFSCLFRMMNQVE